jgi:sugar phosphate isomerase/epimerase
MITGAPPSMRDAGRMLRAALPDYEAAGVALALETYEQVATADLVDLVESIGSPALGVCLDPANTVARLERPQDVIDRCAPVTRGVHVKDFAFARQPGWVGFVYSGAPLGTGLHDYAALRAAVRPGERGINEIVEHWLPWQGDPTTTTATEADWTRIALEHLRSTP